MKTIEYRFVDKTEWPRGEWDNEADKIQWQDEATKLPCMIVRSGSGALCGYVGVSESHPYFGQDYDGIYIDVHGGLTFASRCVENNKEHGICHVVEVGESDKVWWLGFDCNHCHDVAPGYSRYGEEFYSGEYRTIDYVKGEIAALAKQLAEKIEA